MHKIYRKSKIILPIPSLSTREDITQHGNKWVGGRPKKKCNDQTVALGIYYLTCRINDKSSYMPPLIPEIGQQHLNFIFIVDNIIDVYYILFQIAYRFLDFSKSSPPIHLNKQPSSLETRVGSWYNFNVVENTRFNNKTSFLLIIL